MTELAVRAEPGIAVRPEPGITCIDGNIIACGLCGPAIAGLCGPVITGLCGPVIIAFGNGLCAAKSHRTRSHAKPVCGPVIIGFGNGLCGPVIMAFGIGSGACCGIPVACSWGCIVRSGFDSRALPSEDLRSVAGNTGPLGCGPGCKGPAKLGPAKLGPGGRNGGARGNAVGCIHAPAGYNMGAKLGPTAGTAECIGGPLVYRITGDEDRCAVRTATGEGERPEDGSCNVRAATGDGDRPEYCSCAVRTATGDGECQDDRTIGDGDCMRDGTIGALTGVAGGVPHGASAVITRGTPVMPTGGTPGGLDVGAIGGACIL